MPVFLIILPKGEELRWCLLVLIQSGILVHLRHNAMIKPIALGLSITYNCLVMISPKQTNDRNIKTARIKLSNGWKGIVALEIDGRKFSKNDWVCSLLQPQLLFKNIEKVIKTEGRNCVAVRNVTIAEKPFKVVVKRDCPASNLRQLFRSFRPAKAIRNFKTALRLLNCGIPVALPFAALYRRYNLLTKQSIYITAYIENSSNIHNFASEQFAKIPIGKFALKKQLCHQIAAILASLHQNNLWHRDSKASNFVIRKDSTDKYRTFLTDMDGIKPYFVRRKSSRFRSLWRLAASLMTIPDINRTDYLRTFKIYCNLTGLEIARRKQIYRKLTNCAKSKHLYFLSKVLIRR